MRKGDGLDDEMVGCGKGGEGSSHQVKGFV
jgi:hypothetical protein